MKTDYRALARAEAAIREANYRDAASMSRTRVVGDSLQQEYKPKRRTSRNPLETRKEQDARAYVERQARLRQIEAQRVSRDPCPKCAVRADIGCKHQRHA